MKTSILWLLTLLLMGTTPLTAQDVPDFNDPLFRDHGLVMLLIDPATGKIIDANDAAGVYYGYSVERLKQMRIQQINTLNRAEVEMEMERAKTEKRNFFVFRHLLADGSIRPVEVYSSPITINNKPLLYSVILDVSQRETLLETVIENESRMRYAEQVANFGHWLLDLTTGQYQFSEGSTRVLGLDRNSYPAEEIFQMIVPEDRDQLANSHRRLVETNQPYSAVFRFQRPDGTVIDVNSEGNHDETSQQIFGVIRDTTAQQASLRALKSRTLQFYAVLGLAVLVQLGVILLLIKVNQRRQKTELQLKQQKTQLEQRNRALRQFNYAVSHELKTPLVSIESSLGLIQNTLPQTMDPELTTAFGYARTATRQMNNLLESLLLMFRIDKTDSVTETTSFRTLVQDTVDLLTRQNKLEGIKMTIAAEGPKLSGDRDKLMQIWLHLIGNAAKYMGDQKHPAIDIGYEQSDQEIQFFVRDNGMGIEQAYQGKIFGLFDRLDKNPDGTGLGLSLVQRIVDYYGGTIRVESAGAEQGSCFYFTLPDTLSNKGTRA